MRKFLKTEFFAWRQSFEYFSTGILKVLPSRHLRLIILKCLGCHIGKNVAMFSSVEIRKPKGLSIGNGCSIGPHVMLDARKGLKIGNNVTIAYRAIIWTLHHEMNSKDFHGVGAETIIDDYAWICSNSVLLPGIKIGKGSVVASGAVVTKDVEPYSVVGGVPAKKIGERKEKKFSYTPYSKIHFV